MSSFKFKGVLVFNINNTAGAPENLGDPAYLEAHGRDKHPFSKIYEPGKPMKKQKKWSQFNLKVDASIPCGGSQEYRVFSKMANGASVDGSVYLVCGSGGVPTGPPNGGIPGVPGTGGPTTGGPRAPAGPGAGGGPTTGGSAPGGPGAGPPEAPEAPGPRVPISGGGGLNPNSETVRAWTAALTLLGW